MEKWKELQAEMMENMMVRESSCSMKGVIENV